VVALEHHPVIRLGGGFVQALLEDTQGDGVEVVADSGQGQESLGGQLRENRAEKL